MVATISAKEKKRRPNRCAKVSTQFITLDSNIVCMYILNAKYKYATYNFTLYHVINCNAIARKLPIKKDFFINIQNT